ncbi:MAG: hypothetical protein AMJ45_03395 [Syntrophobacter sp. DG_60]|nr:MAG: hypothetical protein AMJ45_03395 [Syntrophobacter sp. DG_60]
MKDAIENFGLEGIYIDSKIDAIAAYMSGTCRNFYFTTEYMQPVEPLRHAYINGIGLPDVDGHFAHPHLWTVEVSAGIEGYLALPMPVELMFRYAGSTEAQPIYEIPRNRWAVGLNTDIYDYATLSLAYAYSDYDPDYDVGYGDNSTNRHLFFTQIAVKF